MIPELPESPTLSRQDERRRERRTTRERAPGQLTHLLAYTLKAHFQRLSVSFFFDQRSEGSCCRDIERGRWIYYIPMFA
jgi:hypothetical protein